MPQPGREARRHRNRLSPIRCRRTARPRAEPVGSNPGWSRRGSILIVTAAASFLRLLHDKLPKRFRRGTHRSVDPAETLARVRPLMARMGITRLGNITGLDRIGIPVAVAVRPNSRSVSVSQGKGLDLPQAMASALMEAAEGFHAEEIEPG